MGDTAPHFSQDGSKVVTASVGLALGRVLIRQWKQAIDWHVGSALAYPSQALLLRYKLQFGVNPAEYCGEE